MNKEQNQIIDFISRRFPKDCDWLNGNCYHFATILKDVFGGELYYDVLLGHFYLCKNDIFYDYNGSHIINTPYLIKWSEFKYYDKHQYDRIYRDCVL